MKKIPTKIILEKIELIISLRKYPVSAAGIMAMIISRRYLMFRFFLKFNNSMISFLKTNITAKIEAKCKKTSKDKSLNLKKYCRIAKCPELLIGNHSAMPWIMLRTIA